MAKNIVLLESKDAFRFSLLDTLIRNGYSVYPAASVMDGSEQYRKAYNNGGVYAVLADIDTKTEALHYTDGYEMCQDIKKR
jgi:DNA-binding response OmpR family regulator